MDGKVDVFSFFLGFSVFFQAFPFFLGFPGFPPEISNPIVWPVLAVLGPGTLWNRFLVPESVGFKPAKVGGTYQAN